MLPLSILNDGSSKPSLGLCHSSTTGCTCYDITHLETSVLQCAMLWPLLLQVFPYTTILPHRLCPTESHSVAVGDKACQPTVSVSFRSYTLTEFQFNFTCEEGRSQEMLQNSCVGEEETLESCSRCDIRLVASSLLLTSLKLDQITCEKSDAKRSQTSAELSQALLLDFLSSLTFFFCFHCLYYKTVGHLKCTSALWEWHQGFCFQI